MVRGSTVWSHCAAQGSRRLDQDGTGIGPARTVVSTLIAGASEPAIAHLCPGVDPSVEADRHPHLRGEIYTTERLCEHAEDVARSHGPAIQKATRGPLLKRLAETRQLIDAAYRNLRDDQILRRDPSPAEEWLLDNAHVVEEQIREIHEDLPRGYLVELPRISSGAMQGYPRVYVLCLDYLRHTDARIDQSILISYVAAYQRVTPLTIGELWAVPIMLRLGLLVIIGSMVEQDLATPIRAHADHFASRLLKSPSSRHAEECLKELSQSPFAQRQAFLVQLMRRLREHHGPLPEVHEWVQIHCEKLGATPEELTRSQHLWEAANQVSIGNVITSMRVIGALEWDEFFSQVSEVEAILASDPALAYPKIDDRSRDRCRHAVERLARRSPASEVDVARTAIGLAKQASQCATVDLAQAHVGYYLHDAGEQILEATIGYRPKLRERALRMIVAHPAFFYFGQLAAITLSLVALVGLGLGVHAPFGLSIPLILLLILPASEVAVGLCNVVVTALLPPRILPKLEFKQGLPSDNTTLVAVPTLLESEAGIAQLLEDLEVRFLANSETHLYFALLSDFTDAKSEVVAGDRELLACAVDGIHALNARHPKTGAPRFWLLHRRRVLNPREACFMGWERKRGKLEELNRFLRGARDTSFAHITVSGEALPHVQFVITLDTDTALPRDVARELIGAIAHPLNRAVVDPITRRAVRGYGIIQPRVGTLPQSSRQSRFARIFAGPPGIDPYTHAVSDVYQDLFREGSYVGKGIYDVDAFQAALDGRVPDNQLLSHDLFEGCFARAALATDIELLDEQPSSYAVAAMRQHRWIRGDWQLLPWLRSKVPSRDGLVRNELRLIDLWKLGDNLRRSLVAPALVLAASFGWLVGGRSAVVVTLAILCTYLAPVPFRILFNLTRSTQRGESRITAARGDLAISIPQWLLGTAFLFDQALLSIDGIVRTLFRLFLSHRRLLEWTTMSQVTRSMKRKNARLEPRALVGVGLVLGLLGAIAVFERGSLLVAAPILSAWLAAPFLALWLMLPEKGRDVSLAFSREERAFLRTVARRTWRFFEEFVSEADHWLPPDNFQEEPRGVVAHRTSPTNIGLYLLGLGAARDFGFITLRAFVQSVERTLSTLEVLEKNHGHLLNWYETTTLAPLEPRYVSTVDSGNLAAHLWTLRVTCRELANAPVLDRACLLAARDALSLSRSAAQQSKTNAPLVLAINKVDQTLQTAFENWSRLGSIDAELAEVGRLAAECLSLGELVNKENAETRSWLMRAQLGLQESHADARRHLAFTSVLLAVPDALADEAAFGALASALGECRTPAELVAVLNDPLKWLDTLEHAVARRTTAATEEHSVCKAYVAKLRAELEDCRNTNAETCGELDTLAGRLGALADAMDFGFLFDAERRLFAIGYSASNVRLDTSHYDLLASEARLASLVAIAKGDVPQEHWFRLGRPRTLTAGRPVLLSWSGSMFEYLMPLLVTKLYRGTLLSETCHAAVAKQIAYGKERDVPWGISEAAYNVMDLGMTYQYRAFGVPGLGLKSGLAEDLVVAPYASVLALLIEPKSALANLKQLCLENLEGVYGYYESVDFTASHLPPGRRSVIVKAYMAHHQGMSLVALDNVLHDQPMQRRFHVDPRIKATALLLEERVPSSTPLVNIPAVEMLRAEATEPDLDGSEYVGIADGARRVHLLGCGELTTVITGHGGGYTSWKGHDINRFREDATLGCGGSYAYVRDLSTQRLWSAGYQPTHAEPDSYQASFHIDRVEFHRRDGAIETLTEVVLSPEFPAEVRRFTLINHDSVPHRLDLTTYLELALAPRAADRTHQAFNSLFIETEALPLKGAILARRRPRKPEEEPVWVAQILTGEGDGIGGLTFETSRALFVGRGHTLANPVGVGWGARLSGTSGSVLDPAIVLRRETQLLPGQRASFSLTTLVCGSREVALELIESFAAPHMFDRTFELAWADSRVELQHVGISAAQSHLFQRLLSRIMFPERALRVLLTKPSSSGAGHSAIWAQGISGDLPLVILRIDSPDFIQLTRELLLAHEFWRLNGVFVDLMIVNHEPSGYLQPLKEALLDLIGASAAESLRDQPGGVFLRTASLIAEADLELICHMARVVLSASRGALAQQLRNDGAATSTLPPRLKQAYPRTYAPPTLTRPKLTFDNGIGGFTADGREYLMVLGPGQRPPAPWCNVMSNPNFGCVVSEAGSGATWHRNSQRHRLTPWSNDAICDPPGELFYVRDEEDGVTRSLTPGPARSPASYIVRHGAGYSAFEHTEREIEHELLVFVAREEPAKLFRIRLRNQGRRARRHSLYGIVEWVLGGQREVTRLTTTTEWFEADRAIVASNPFSPFPQARAVFACSGPVDSMTCDREEFFGLSGSHEAPAALQRVMLSGTKGSGYDPCAAFQLPVKLEAGETFEVTFVLAEGNSLDEALALAAKYSDSAKVQAEFESVNKLWDDVLGNICIKTPDPALDLMTNRFLLYQTLSCRFWGRAAFYQASGAFGFRDQLQDALAFLHCRPELTREHLLRAARRQFAAGDVQHWWHAETGEGIRSNCSDDMLWLPYVAAEYVLATGDLSVLDEALPFLEERSLKPGEEDLFGCPPASLEHFSLYEHCLRALSVGTTQGPHGLPTIRAGDWNDGMNRVGTGGQGESVWLAWFLAATLQKFGRVARLRGDTDTMVRGENQLKHLTHVVNEHAWDGEWYRRAFFDDGTPLGTHTAAECTIDAIAQSWATIAGIGDPARAERALQAAETHLIRKEQGLMCLLTPPFDLSTPDPGYISAYPPGVRENGGQYTHGVLWTVLALCMSGEGDRAHRLMAMLNPISHGDGAGKVRTYQVEPYVVAADVYASPQHMGRGGWTWYTGAAGWMYTITISHILGLRLTLGQLQIDPCIPSAWPRFEATYRYKGATYHIRVENPHGVCRGVVRFEVDGNLVPGNLLKLCDDGAQHQVQVMLGGPDGRSDRG